MRHFKLFALFPCLAALASVVQVGCASEVTTAGDEPIASQGEEVINGRAVTTNDFGSVAIFHKETASNSCDSGSIYDPDVEIRGTNKWWPRPCSGKIISKDSTYYYVLTARHCATTNGEIDGILSTDPHDFRVTTDTDPGTLQTSEGVDANGTYWMQVNEEPSPTYPTATVFAAGTPKGSNASSGLAKDDHGEDLALLKVLYAQHFDSTNRRIALTTDPISVNGQVFSKGYGRYVPGYCQGHDGSGAGHLRWGALINQSPYPIGFPVTSVTPKTFDIAPIENGSYDVMLAGGDSGSPMYTQSFVNGYTGLAGVVSSGKTMAGGANLMKWLMQNMGYLYLIEYGKYLGSNELIGAASDTDGSSVLYGQLNDNTLTRAKYDWTTKNLKFGARCATDEGGYVRMRACTTSSSQKWTIEGIQIKNAGTARCLMRGPSEVVASTCSTTSNYQRWLFVTDN